MFTPAMKSYLKRFATKADLKRFATKSDLKKYATKSDLRREVSQLRSDMQQWKEESRLHFDVVVERMDGIVKMINTEVLKDHSDRLVRVETMVGIR